MLKGLRQTQHSPPQRTASLASADASPFFDVVLTGRSRAAVPAEHAAVQLARLLRISAQDAHRLLSGKPCVVRAQLPLAAALRYQMALQRVGAECQVNPSAANEAWDSGGPGQTNLRAGPTPSQIPEHPLQRPATPATEPGTAPRSPTSKDAQPTWWRPVPAPIPQPTLADEGLAALTAVWGMSLLLLTYGAAILAVAGGSLWHAWTHAHWLSTGLPFIFPLTYVALITVGTGLTMVLLRPLLAQQCDDAGGAELSVERAPALFDLVERVANALGAPQPARVRLTWHTTVRVVPGPHPDAPELLIGLPALAALSLEELTVALVRALAPFSSVHRSKLHRTATEMEAFLRCAARGPDSWDRLVEEQLGTSRDGQALALLLAAWILRATRYIFVPGFKLARFAARRIRSTEAAKQDTLAARFTSEHAVASAALKLRLLREAETVTSQAALQLGVKNQPVRELAQLTVERAVRAGRLSRPDQAAATLVANFSALSIAATAQFYQAAGATHQGAKPAPASRQPARG